tara:strand:- start:189 stop:1004 length:816 start_codon:yes stop_codon:yes gene_type:complete
MKIAVCFSGVLRTGVHAFPNIKQYYGNYFNNIDFFMHTWDIENWGADWYSYPHPHIDDSLWESLEKRKSFKLQDSKLEKMESLYKFKKLETTSIFGKVDPLFNHGYMWESFKRSIELKQKYEKENNFEYDIVVKSRPDILLRVAPVNFNIRKSKKFSSFKKDVELVKSDNIVAINCKYDQPNRTLDDVFWMGNNKVQDNLADFSANTEPITPWDAGDDTILYQQTWRSGTFCDAKGVKFCEANSQEYIILRDHLVHLDPILDFSQIKKEGY